MIIRQDLLPLLSGSGSPESETTLIYSPTLTLQLDCPTPFALCPRFRTISGLKAKREQLGLLRFICRGQPRIRAPSGAAALPRTNDEHGQNGKACACIQEEVRRIEGSRTWEDATARRVGDANLILELNDLLAALVAHERVLPSHIALALATAVDHMDSVLSVDKGAMFSGSEATDRQIRRKDCADQRETGVCV